MYSIIIVIVYIMKPHHILYTSYVTDTSFCQLCSISMLHVLGSHLHMYHIYICAISNKII